ncbi:MAG: HNH endonuclease [Actinomycetia bacterium]|nr:HNH endonuclease [Actinomycetes bacterium]
MTRVLRIASLVRFMAFLVWLAFFVLSGMAERTYEYTVDRVFGDGPQAAATQARAPAGAVDAPAVPTSTDAATSRALLALQMLAVEPEDFTIGYDRNEWEGGHAGGWADVDGDCRNTRHEVLAASSIDPVQYSADGCWVVAGRWWDPYTDRSFTDPSDVDIDHVVAVAEAHRSGGAAWSAAKKNAFYNELSGGNLLAVHDAENRTKSADDPAQYLPPNGAVHCAYVTQWIETKQDWGLSVDAAERQAMADVLVGCAADDLTVSAPSVVAEAPGVLSADDLPAACGEFASRAEAQAFLDDFADLGDPAGIDPDGNGVACG